jgi:hypothetical protein
LDLTGLVITLTKSNSSTQDVAFADFVTDGITTAPANGAALATTDTQVVISDNGKTADQTITVNAALINNSPGGGVNYYLITSSAGANGSISPTPSVDLAYGSNQTFTITPAAGYQIAGVLVDGASVGTVATYTFSNIVASHTISATFSAIPSGSSNSSSSSSSSNSGSTGSSNAGGSTAKPGDVNGDGKVDELDLSIMMSEWGQTGTGLAGDLNHDGIVDELDFSILMANWGS